MEKNLGAIVNIDDMPDEVHTHYAYLLDNTDTEPVVERTGYGKILLTHQSDRVYLTVSFRLNGRTWGRTDSKLVIDGKRVPNATGWDMYVSIFKDPDNGRRDFVPEGAKKAKVPESRPVDEEYAPKAVADVLKRVRKSPFQGPVDIELRITLDQSRYMISVHAHEDGSRMMALFKLDESKSTWAFDDLLLMNHLGYDVLTFQSRAIQKQMLSMLGADSRANQVSFVPGGRSEGAAVTNSVQVRKATVVRT